MMIYEYCYTSRHRALAPVAIRKHHVFMQERELNLLCEIKIFQTTMMKR